MCIKSVLDTEKTNGNGFYQFKSLKAGTYTLKIFGQHYIPYMIKDIQVLENSNIASGIELSKMPKNTKHGRETSHRVGKISIHYQD